MNDGKVVCGAKTRKGTCGSSPMKGGKRCRMHGGASPQALNAAARRVAEQQISASFSRVTIEPVANPLDALAQLAGEVVAWKNLLGTYVEKLTGQRTDDYGDSAPGVRYQQEYGGEQIRGEVVLFERALDRCSQVLTAIAKLNIDDRLTAIGERQIDLLEAVLEAGMAELDLSPDDRARMWGAVHVKLASVA
jgi:hypothetical protein